MSVLSGQTARSSDIPGDAATADVATLESTTTTSYTDLTTPGPAVSVSLVSGQQCVVTIACSLSSAGSSGRMSFAVSGASTVAASANDEILIGTFGTTTAGIPGYYSTIYTASASGTHTFTAKYRTGSSTSYFQHRRITAVPISV